MRRIPTILLALLAAGWCAADPPLPARQTAPSQKGAADVHEEQRHRHSTEARRVISDSIPAYVFVGGGSGAIISADGYVITNHHVAGGSKRWRLRTPDGRSHIAERVGSAPGTDLALLKIRDARDLPHLPLGDSDALAPGETVFAVGNPFGMGSLDGKPTVTMGVVGATGVHRARVVDAIITDAPVNPGNSGGPLINLHGELVGVNGQISSRFGIRANAGTGYAISSNQIRRLLEALKTARGEAVHLGSVNGAKFEQNPRGSVKVLEVRPRTPAAEAGIRGGDVVRSLGGRPVLTVGQISSLAQRYPAGASVPVRVERKGKPVTLQLTLEKREQGALGIAFRQRPDGQSLEIGSVVPGGPADVAGIKAGDVIVAIGRYKLESRRVLQRLLPGISPGQRIALTLRRGDQTLRATVQAIAVSELRRLQKASPETKAADAGGGAQDCERFG